jgi:hypothetical protein
MNNQPLQKYVECATNECISYGAKHFIDIQFVQQCHDAQNLHTIQTKYFKNYVNERQVLNNTTFN